MHVVTVAQITIASTMNSERSLRVFEAISIKTDVADILTMVISNFSVTFI